MVVVVVLLANAIVVVAHVGTIVVVLVDVGRGLALADVGHSSFSYNESGSPHMPCIIPLDLRAAPESWRLLLIVWILRQPLLFL